MWKQILANVNAVILKNWAVVVGFVVGALAATFLMSCSMFTTIEVEGDETPAPVVEEGTE